MPLLTDKDLDIKTTRRVELATKVLIIDGLPGCGKTMLSPIVSALDRVEKLTFAFDIEGICHLHCLGKLDLESAQTMVRIFTDMKLYNMMMGREVNFRIKDLSGVFMDAQPWRYIKRIFGPGDETVPARVQAQRPILHLTTHQLLSIGHPVFHALKDRLVLVDLVRHPLYMIKQQTLNIERLIADARYFNIHIEYQGQEIPYWTLGWQDVFMRSNAVERAAHSIIHNIDRTKKSQETLPAALKENIVTVPFEDFVLAPDGYMQAIISKLGTQMTPLTVKMMRRQKVPRQKIAAGLDLPIYRRCGWKPATGASEEQELADRRNWMAGRVAGDVLRLFDACCREYERIYLGGVKDIPGRPQG